VTDTTLNFCEVGDKWIRSYSIVLRLLTKVDRLYECLVG
jgi:hypothetical protein